MKRVVGRWVPAMMELAAALRQQSVTGRDEKHRVRAQESGAPLFQVTYQLLVAAANKLGHQITEKMGVKAPRWLALLFLIGLLSSAVNDDFRTNNGALMQPFLSAASAEQATN